MSSKFVRDEIKSVVNTWGLLPLHDINDPRFVWPSDPDLGAWVGIQFTPSDEEQASVGSPDNNIMREYGVIFCHIVAPFEVSYEDALDYAESLRTYLRNRYSNGLQIYSVDPPQLGENASIVSDGNWYGVAISFDYKYDLYA